MVKRKFDSVSKVSFHKDFNTPTKKDRADALGDFPLSIARPEALWQHRHCEAPNDLNQEVYYHPTKKIIPAPTFELDWLAQVPEEGQGVSDYVCFLTSRSGRLRPIANASCSTICLLPIVNSESSDAAWPEHAPRLEALVKLTSSYYQRPVKVLKPATITNPKKKKKQQIVNIDSKLTFSDQQGDVKWDGSIKGRHDSKSNRFQFEVTSMLNQLSWYRDNLVKEENFCVMGVTVEDLYDGKNDLFCAGMAFGGSKVAVFSFHRYHPRMRMNPLKWYDYGYSTRSGRYSYFDAEKGAKAKLLPNPQGLKRDPASEIEFLRRSSKLLLHELGHLYGLDHCIHYKCLMMGSGHLVEDFQSPLQLCGICLRKMQWRLGFAIEKRYNEMADSLTDCGMTKEAGWIRRHLGTIRTKKKKLLEDQEKKERLNAPKYMFEIKQENGIPN